MSTHPIATPDKNKDETHDSADTPSSSASEHSAQAVSPGAGFSDTQMAQLRELISASVNPIRDDLRGIDNRLSAVEAVQANMNDELRAINKRLSTLEKRTGLLVEEKARSSAARQFGEDFSRRFFIKSVHDLVKLISKAHTNSVQNDQHSRNCAAKKLVQEYLEPLLPVFMKAMVYSVKEASEAPEFAKKEFDQIKKNFSNRAVDPVDSAVKNLSKGGNTESLQAKDKLMREMNRICGSTLHAVKELSETPIEGEDPSALKTRAKLMTARFKRKLDRMKLAFQGDLESCKSPGIMLLSFLSCADKEKWGQGKKGLREWAESHSSKIFDSQEEIECDCTPSILAIDQHATIQVGEIKSSLAQKGKACEQMELQAKLVELGLFALVRDDFQIVTRGHLFVLEAPDDSQSLQSTEMRGISLFVHRVT